MSDNILIIAAHPDDEVLGCGGTIVRHVCKGDNCYITILAEGITARDNIRNSDNRKLELDTLKGQSKKVARLLGAHEVEFNSFPDNRMDSINLIDVVKVVEKAIDKFRPDIIYTHHYADLNIDHQITAKAVETATRPIIGKTHFVSEIYSFEILSSTEWSFANQHCHFHPNYFVDINESLEIKIEALSLYRSEVNDFPHPRSYEAVVNLSKIRGSQAGLYAAEAFSLIRKII